MNTEAAITPEELEQSFRALKLPHSPQFMFY